jgi:ribokinase
LTVAVVGSINSDLVLQTPRIPQPGETVIASTSAVHNGGKGANQAVALARLGQPTSLIGCIGNDPDGDRLMAALIENDVDVAMVARVERPTGLAVIVVDKHGENTIVGHSGANGGLTPELVAEAAGILAAADVTLVQMEIPGESVAEALRTAAGITLLNPAPAAPLDGAVLAHVDVLLPNRTELGILAGTETPESERDVIDATRALGFNGIVVVTLGSEGSIVIHPDGSTMRAIPPAVRVVDTVGAGDAFCAGFAHATALGLGLDECLTMATACGAHATSIHGAQPSMPTHDDATRLLARVTLG